MKLIGTLAVLATAWTWATAAVIPCPANESTALFARVSSQPSPLDYAMGNLSSLFGWQIAGAALSTNELDAGCNDISSLGHGRWIAGGLVPANIREPLCNASHASPSPSIAAPHIVVYSTELFTTYLLNSFASGNVAAFPFLCTNLDNLLLNGFYYDDFRVINAICTAAGLPTAPRREGSLFKINFNATQAYFNTASILYALMYASGAPSDSQLNIYCAHAPNYMHNFDGEFLNGTLVKQTLCQITQPIDIAQGANFIRTWISRLYMTAIESVSGVQGWLGWLCSNLDVTAMNAVGLDGEAVHTQVCQDAQRT